LPAPAAGARASFLLGATRNFCCAGCEAVARAIVDGGFERYYETRLRPARTPRDFSRIQSAGGHEAALMLEGVTCAACLWLIEQALRRTSGVTRAHVDFTTQRAHVAWDADSTDLYRVVAAVNAVGYGAAPYEARAQERLRQRERRGALWRLFVAGFGAMQGMMYAFPAYVSDGELSPDDAAMMRWAGLLITAPVVLIACLPFFQGAWRELRAGRIGLDTPIALGVGGGFLASAWATVAGTGEVYFDSISMLAFLLLGARFAESSARARAAAPLDRLYRTGSSSTLRTGERVTVAPGQSFAADGVVESGASSAEESLLTGESRPVPKRAGDVVLAGSVNLEQPLVVRVTRAGAATRAAGLARLAERAAASRPRLVEAADRAAALLTPLVLVIAALAAWHAGNVWIAVAVLVATCPCALALAAPIVLTRANASLFLRGALVTRSGAYQALAHATDVVLDKTGTLTTGALELGRIEILGRRSREECLALASSLEAASRHPAARAFASPRRFKVEDEMHVPGLGIEGRVDGLRVRIGAERFCQELAGGPPPGPCHQNFAACRVFLAQEGAWLAAFELCDALRPDAAALVAALKARGLEVHLASGDRVEAGAAVAHALWIERFAGGLTPEAKCAYLERLQRQGRVVVMVGDGLNDAAVLARADTSFAMGGGADAAQLRADIVLAGDRLAAIPEALDTARAAMRMVRANLAWALAYNALALPLAALGWIGPWEAALGMGASSLIVMLNAWRPLGPKDTWKASTSSSRSPSPSYS
jgi:P-type Cu2+ transporter